MKTTIDNINQIKSSLEKGEIIAVPTDTIYGVASNIDNYKKIIEIKKRDKKPLAILCHNIETMQKIISIPDVHLNTLKELTPGALTIVGKTIDNKYNINEGFDTTGVRIPDHPSLLKVLEETGPLVVSSANISGGDETYTLEEVENVFKESISLYVENNQALSKSASTVLNIDTLDIYREGENYIQILEKLKNDLR